MDIIEFSGGGDRSFFKPKDEIDKAAFLIEVKEFVRQRPTNFGPKDGVRCTIHTFVTDEDAKAGKAEVAEDALIEAGILVRDLAPLVGSATIVKLGVWTNTKPGGHDGWIFKPVDAAIRAAIVAYVEQREAARQAALDSVPDFE